MVKIAVAGGTGNVATEILRAPVASNCHSITIFTRSDPSTLTHVKTSVTYKKVDYQSRESLVEALQGFDVCLSFLVVHQDDDCRVQKNLIHACIDAGVRRFAPSEWGIKNNSGCPPYENKDTIATYLARLDKNGELIQNGKRGLQYCLFQPSIFLDYFAHPHPQSPNLITWPFFIDFENKRAMILDDGNQPLVLTAISDISAILARALDDDERWPAVGGMQGTRTSINELVRLGKKLRGGEWCIEHIKSSDIEAGELKASWVPQMSHPVIASADRETFSKEFVIMFFTALRRGSWDVSDEWNRRYPDFKFQSAEEYLTKAWEGKE